MNESAEREADLYEDEMSVITHKWFGGDSLGLSNSFGIFPLWQTSVVAASSFMTYPK